MGEQPRATDENQIVLDRDLTVVNGIYCKKILLEGLGGCTNIVIDLERVSDCDTAGIQLLLSLNKSAQANNQNVRFVHVPGVIIEMMEKYGIRVGETFNINQSLCDDKNHNDRR